MLKARCSSLPLITQCASAAQPPRVKIELGDPAVPAMGSAVHDVLAPYITGRPFDFADIASKWQVEQWELDKVGALACRRWDKVKQYFPNPKVEVALSFADDELTLTGHADLVSLVDAAEGRVEDHKAGFGDFDFSQQVTGYAFLCYKTFGVKKWRGHVLRVRSGELLSDDEAMVWTADELEDWWVWLKRHLKEAAYRPAMEACRLCRRYFECDGAALMSKAARELLIDFAAQPKGELPVSADMAIALVEAARMVEKAGEIGRLAAKLATQKAGGRIQGSDGRALEIGVQRRREIAYKPESLHLISQTIGTERLGQVAEFAASKLDKVVKDTAPRGMKDSAVNGLNDRLKEAGCLTYTEIERLELKSAPKKAKVLA